MRISPRSAKTIRGRYSPQQLAQQGIGARPDEQRVAFLSQRAAGQRASGPRNRTGFALALWLSGDAGDDPAQKKRVIIAFQMHFRPQRWDGVADAQTEAIAEALLEKYGRG